MLSCKRGCACQHTAIDRPRKQSDLHVNRKAGRLRTFFAYVVNTEANLGCLKKEAIQTTETTTLREESSAVEPIAYDSKER